MGLEGGCGSGTFPSNSQVRPFGVIVSSGRGVPGYLSSCKFHFLRDRRTTNLYLYSPFFFLLANFSPSLNLCGLKILTIVKFHFSHESSLVPSSIPDNCAGDASAKVSSEPPQPLPPPGSSAPATGKPLRTCLHMEVKQIFCYFLTWQQKQVPLELSELVTSRCASVVCGLF